MTAQETIPLASHHYVIVDAVPATCEETGLTSYVECTACGYILIPSDIISALGHDWGEPTYTWADDNRTVTATRKCSRNESHFDSETVDAYRHVTISPTQTETGEFEWIGNEFENSVFTVQKTDGGSIPALKDITVLVLPTSLKAIETEAFDSVSAEAIILPEGCITVEPKAFVNCTSLLYVYIPSGVEISADAFAGCPNVAIDQE